MNALGVDFASLAHATATFGYPILFALVVTGSAGAPLPIGLLLAALGAASVQSGGPDFGLLAASGMAASVVGDGLDFGIGRLGGQRALRWAQARLRRSRLLAPLSRMGAPPRQEALIFLSRFALTPLATPASLLAGASGLGVAAFFLWDALGEGVFVVGNLTLGRFLSGNDLLDDRLLLIMGAIALLSYAGLCLPWRLFLGRGQATSAGRTDVPACDCAHAPVHTALSSAFAHAHTRRTVARRASYSVGRARQRALRWRGHVTDGWVRPYDVTQTTRARRGSGGGSRGRRRGHITATEQEPGTLCRRCEEGMRTRLSGRPC